MSETELQEQINQTLSGFMSNADIHLRNKLSVLLPALDLLEKRLKNHADDAMIRYLGEARKSAYAILRMSGNMGDYAKFIRNYGQSEPIRVNLSELVTTLLHETAQLAQYRQGAFTLECRENPFFAIVDKDQIESLLYHLLSNAVLYGEGDITTGLKRSDGNIIITVSNKGGVIPGETLSALYSGYSEYANAQTRNLGLGLPIALAIACQSGGTLAVTSDEKNGTVVTVSLPDLLTGSEPIELENHFMDEYGGYIKILVAMADFPDYNSAYNRVNEKGGTGSCTISSQ